jgi:hypothetical protein
VKSSIQLPQDAPAGFNKPPEMRNKLFIRPLAMLPFPEHSPFSDYIIYASPWAAMLLRIVTETLIVNILRIGYKLLVTLDQLYSIAHFPRSLNFVCIANMVRTWLSICRRYCFGASHNRERLSAAVSPRAAYACHCPARQDGSGTGVIRSGAQGRL